MGNDCQACGPAQAHVRQSISSEYLLTTRIDAANRNQMLSIFWLPRRPNQSRGGRRGSSKCPAAINCHRSVPLDSAGPVWRHTGEQSAGATPRRRGPFCPPARGRKATLEESTVYLTIHRALFPTGLPFPLRPPDNSRDYVLARALFMTGRSDEKDPFLTQILTVLTSIA
jgi:hypothetical protein